jgi:ribosomal protein S18 acetylase RimI-like enzyme
LEIRSARAKDAPFLSGLLHELGFPSSAGEITARIKGMRGSALVAVSGGKVVGLVTTDIMPVLHRPTAVGRVSALVVSKRVRGKGIGRALMTVAEKLLEERGCGLVEVTSNLRLKNAHSFFRRLGYETTSLRFKKRLNPA